MSIGRDTWKSNLLNRIFKSCFLPETERRENKPVKQSVTGWDRGTPDPSHLPPILDMTQFRF